MINCFQSNYIWQVSHKENFFQVSSIYISHTGERLEIEYANQKFWWPYWMTNHYESSNICSGPTQESLIKCCQVVSEKKMSNEQKSYLKMSVKQPLACTLYFWL